MSAERKRMLVENVAGVLTRYGVEAASLAYIIGRSTVTVERWLRGAVDDLDDEAERLLRVFFETHRAVTVEANA
jgi:hypothetical protein